MAKGFFTQGMSLLTDGRTAIDSVRTALEKNGFEIVNQTAAQDNWCFGGATVVIPFLPQVNGYVTVDVVDHPWPDTMGDPKSDPMMFGAWSMGYFGPFAFPGSLTRAGQHSWTWEPGRAIAGDHHGFIRVRMSYVLGAQPDRPVMPEDYRPLKEMEFLSRVVLAAFDARGTICYFNPNGEVLRDSTSFREIWEDCIQQQALPLPLWMNIRFFHLSDEFSFMDTVGNAQLDIRDVEAVFPKPGYDPARVDYYLRNVTHYLLDLDRELRTGEAIDGPGESDLSWTMDVLDESLAAPPRRIVRLYPKTEQKAVREALAALKRSQG